MTQAIHYGLPLSGEILKEKWRDFARLDGIPSNDWLKLSSGWLESFKNRHQLRAFRKHGEAASVDLTVVASEIERIQDFTKDYDLKDIFNMDETGLFYLYAFVSMQFMSVQLLIAVHFLFEECHPM